MLDGLQHAVTTDCNYVYCFYEVIFLHHTTPYWSDMLDGLQHAVTTDCNYVYCFYEVTFYIILRHISQTCWMVCNMLSQQTVIMFIVFMR